MVIKSLTELRNFQKIYNKIIQKQLQMRMRMKHLKKDIYIQKKDKTLLIMWNWYNSILMEYEKIIRFVRQKTESTN